MLRLTVSILLTLWACVSLNAAEPQSLGILRVSVDSTAADIGPDLANANSASIIISTDIRDLKLQISSQSIGDPLIEALEYDSVTHEYFYSVKPLTGGQKYILTLTHKRYRAEKIQLNPGHFKNAMVQINVDGDLPIDIEKERKQPSPVELFERGMQFYNGDGVGKSYPRAFRLFQLAADNGHAEAMYYIGLLYENWNKLNEAKRWYKRAAGYYVPKASSALKRLAEVQGERRPLGIAVGYTARQLRTSDGAFPWCGIGGSARSSSPAWTAGLYWTPEFKYGLGIQTGIYADFASDSYEDISVFDCNVSIPVRVQYRYAIMNYLSVFVFTGPGFDMGLAYNVSVAGHPEDNFSLYDVADISRFNLTWGFGAGLRWNGLQIMFTSDWGLLNVLEGSKGGARLNKPFGVNIAYNFKLK